MKTGDKALQPPKWFRAGPIQVGRLCRGLGEPVSPIMVKIGKRSGWFLPRWIGW